MLLACLLTIGSGCTQKTEEEKAFDRALEFAERSQAKEAMAEFTRAITINPKFTDAYFNRAAIYLLQNNTEAALLDLNKAVDINPRLAPPYNARGLIYTRLGKTQKAISNFNKAIELNTNFGAAYCNRAEAYYAQQDYFKSWSDTQKASAVGFPCNKRLTNYLQEKTKGTKD